MTGVADSRANSRSKNLYSLWHVPCAKQLVARLDPGKEILTMRHILSVALFSLFCASLAGCTAARDHRIIYQRYAGYNYCHTKVEIPSDLRPSDREIVDYYGPCDAFD